MNVELVTTFSIIAFEGENNKQFSFQFPSFKECVIAIDEKTRTCFPLSMSPVKILSDILPTENKNFVGLAFWELHQFCCHIRILLAVEVHVGCESL